MKTAFDGGGHKLVHLYPNPDLQSGLWRAAVGHYLFSGFRRRPFQDIESFCSWRRDFYQSRFVSFVVFEYNLEPC